MGTIAQRILDELDRIPSLEILRTDPSLTVQKEPATDAQSGTVGIVGDPVAIDLSDHGFTLSNLFDNIPIWNIFDGMDNLSWLYLGTEHPVSSSRFV